MQTVLGPLQLHIAILVSCTKYTTPKTSSLQSNLKAIMQANSAFLNKLKSDAIEKNRKYSNKAWLLCTASVFLVAVCYNSCKYQ